MLTWRRNWELVRILWSAHDINTKIWKDVIFLSEKEKEEIKIQQCADTLEQVFIQLAKTQVTEEKIDVYKDNEGEAAIKMLIDWKSSFDAMSLFHKLKSILSKKWFTVFRPSAKHFVDTSSQYDKFFRMTKKQVKDNGPESPTHYPADRIDE